MEWLGIILFDRYRTALSIYATLEEPLDLRPFRMTLDQTNNQQANEFA